MANPNIPMDPKSIIDLIILRRWILLIPFCLSLMVGIYLSITLPKIYQAETLILVEPQRVPSEYVKSVVSMDIGSRISTISQQIMSRTNLEKVINDFKLFSEEPWQNKYLEDKLENLRKRITVDVINRRYGADAFRISFNGSSPERVKNVVNALASYFINENLKVREMQAIGTSTFLDTELQSMKKRLETNEEKLTEYKRYYMGGLPEQLQTNLRILESLQNQRNEKQTIIRGVEQNIYTIKNTDDSFSGLNGELSMNDLLVDFDENGEAGGSYELAELKEELARLKLRYKDKHPDVIQLKRRIMELEEQNENEIAKVETSETLPEETAMPAIDFQKIQLAELRSTLDVHKRELDQIDAQIEIYKKRIEDTPRREQELLSIERDYDNLKTSYESLLKRKLESEIAVNMERRQKGEQFRILDSAQLPEKPISPDMKKLFLLFLVAGIAIGGGGIFLLEYFDPSFKRPEDIEKELDLVVLCSVPRLLDAKRKRLKRIEKVAFFTCLSVSMGLFTVFTVITLKGVNQSMELIKRIVT
jgi:polysaccharide chain length determinant protein (PEP-CTERM system associated)